MKMRLLCIFAAVVAISLAKEVDINKKIIDDLEAAESIELQKEIHDLKPEASVYSYVPQQTWNQPQKYVHQQTWTPPNKYVPPITISPPQYDYPQNPHYRPTYPPHTWTTPHYTYPPTTTTPVPVIKNEQYFGDNGSYKYEYQIGDGTHVGEEGYFTDPKASDESIVKKGWYTFTGGDGKVYTVTWWADHTGYHAFGDHLPTPPPVPPAIQAAIDQNAKEEAAKAEAEKHKPQYYPEQPQNPTYYPTQKPIYYPTQPPTYYPTQPTYYPPHQPNHPSYGK